MSTFSCQICGRQLPSIELRDKHQSRCEDAAYEHVHIERKRTEALSMACRNCGQVHATEAQQIACDVRQWETDQMFEQYRSDNVLAILERTRDARH